MVLNNELKVAPPPTQTQTEGYLRTPLFDLCGCVSVSTVCSPVCALMPVCKRERKRVSVVLDLQGNMIYVVEL